MADDNLAPNEPVSNDAPAASVTAEPLGRVIAVGGSHVMVQFSSTMLSESDLSVGAFLGIWNGRTLVVGSLCDVSLHKNAEGQPSEPATGRVDLLGELVLKPGEGFFQRGVTTYPRIGSPIVPIGQDALGIIFNAAGPTTINVGYLQQDASIGAYIDVDDMVGKHFAIFGSTGAGKSSAVAVLLREITEARGGLRVLLMDPHNEYAGCFADRAHVVRPDNLRLPYWLFNFDEMIEIVFGRRTEIDDEIGLLAELIPLAKNEHARHSAAAPTGYRNVATAESGRYTVDTPVPYRMNDLIAIAETRMGKLENVQAAGQYRRLIARIQSVRKNPRYSFIFNDDAVGSDTMVDILCDLLRLDGDERPMTIVQLAGFPTEVFDAIVSVLFRLSFEFGLWSDGALPLLIVCEEAHNYANADRTVGFRPAREAVSRIAKEGRKYGVFLGLVSQRPAQLDPTLVSQCSTVFAMRIANEDDQRIVRAGVSDPGNRLLGFLSSLGTREALAFGAGVPVATRMRFKELPERFVPSSEAVWGGRIDAGTPVDRNLVASVVARWRGLASSNRPLREGMTPSHAAESSFDPLSWTAPGLK